MPRGKSTRVQREWESGDNYRKQQSYGMNAEFSGWINSTLPTSMKDAYDTWYASPAAFTDFQEVMDRHYRISVGEDVRDGGYVANAFMRLESSPHAGKMTSQRSSNPTSALFKLVYAIIHVMPENWRTLEDGTGDDW